jgi:DNA-directed RNA polymerase subunit K/omega
MELMQGARPLIEDAEGMGQLQIVIEEIKRDKIAIDYEHSDIDKPGSATA